MGIMERLRSASALIHEGQYDSALKILQGVISSKSSVTTKLMALVMLANILKFKGDYKNLCKIYKTLIQYLPTYRIYMNYAEANILIGKFSTACES